MAGHPNNGEESSSVLPADFSKRAARRLIQRAFVLAGRDRQLRQHIREARVIILWVVADWNFEWTVALDRGRIAFDRRPSKKPDLTLTWESAEEFFRQAESLPYEPTCEREGEISAWNAAGPLVRTFFAKLEAVLRHPVDDDGVSLI